MKDFDKQPEVSSDFESLLNLLCDGNIEPAQRDRLEQLLQDNPSLLKVYVDHMGVETGLTWRYRTGKSESSNRQTVDSEHSAGATWLPGTGLYINKRWMGILALAVGLLFILASTHWFTNDSLNNQAASQPASSELPQLLATLRESSAVVWSNGDSAVDVGGRIGPGALRVEDGEAELVFDSGAKLRIGGPAELELESPLLARLIKGRVAAHMPTTATGFELQTPTSKLVDQGTEFGVLVEDSGATQVHVFRGQVDVHFDGDEGALASKVELRDREARRIERLGDSGTSIPFSKIEFGGLARRVVEPTKWAIADGGNGHYYQLVVEDQPITWHEAARLAMGRHHRGMPGHLVTMTADEENRFVIEKLLEGVPIRGAWMGLTDSLREGHFNWVTGEQYDFSAWAKWPEPQPDNFREADWHGGEDYGMFTQFLDKQPWAWNDLSIDSMYEKVSAYVVEYEPPVAALKNGSMALDPIHWSKEDGGNGNYYRIVLVLEPTRWEEIDRLARQSEVLGTQGHLVALESEEEREFVANEILRICGIPEMMIGLSGSLEADNLRWATGVPVENLEVERSHLPTDHVYGVFRWNPAGKWQTGWEIRAMSKDVLPAGWFGYLVEYPVGEKEEGEL